MGIRFGLVLCLCLLVAAQLAGAASVSRSSSPVLPAPTFRSSPAWWTITTGSTKPSGLAPQVWAITTARSNAAALVPFDLFNGLRRLSRGAVLIWATTAGRGGPTGTFTRASWPLRLPTFRVDRMWEGQPALNVQQRLRWASVGGWQLDVRVYFATQHPGEGLLRAAQAELDRLLLPRSR
jgi:hypothetical protein